MPDIFQILAKVPPLLRVANRLAINHFALRTPPRPHRFSLWSPSRPRDAAPRDLVPTQPSATPPAAPREVSDYTAWPGLVDRHFSGRHLPPRPATDRRPLPPIDRVVAELERKQQMVPSERSTALFCFFAQWFTDSFLRKNPEDARRTTSNHEIDLCQIYGLDEASTWALRTGNGGLLKHRTLADGEYPPLLYKDGELDPQYFDPNSESGLTYLRAGRAAAWVGAIDGNLPGGVLSAPERRDHFYASGLDRGGSTLIYSAFNTIFLREHNRLARAIAAANAGWDDDRLFETARLVNVRQLLTVVINDYIRHIGGSFPFFLDRSFASRKPWYRSNRISIEFDLLYRWHSLVPDHFDLGGESLQNEQYRFNNELLERHGLEAVVTAASNQPAGRVGLFNTPSFLTKAEWAGLQWARDFRVESLNAYRQRFHLRPYRSIAELAGAGSAEAAVLDRLYGGDVNAVEYTVGLLAEARGRHEVLSETLTTMVAYDAFTHILTNPTLADELNCEATFSNVGWSTIGENATLQQIVSRNCTKPVEVKLAL